MCGRYALNISGEDLAIEFAAGVKDAAYTPSNWNISPTTVIPFISSDYEKVGAALHLPVVIPETAQPIKANSDNLSVGKKVCFTGEAIGFNGEQISREDLEALAAKVGLHPVSSVTKKGCDVLVAADESSMSGKAKKAKDWGIPVISVEKFITFCTFG